MNAFRVADIWVELMKALGYDRFAAQGGDIGAGVSTALGLRHSEHLTGLHLNYIPGSYRPSTATGPALTEAEIRFSTETARWYDEDGAYAHLQGTRPQTSAYALNSSPTGLAAWTLEKFRDWSDCNGDLYSRFSHDELLTNGTLYWMTQTITSSFRMYAEGRKVRYTLRPMISLGHPARLHVFRRRSANHHVNGSSAASTFSAGPSCLEVAILLRPRSRRCSREIFGPSFAICVHRPQFI